ncbi:MAG: FMN-dependent NADH-azoreductase [Steroidobacteraceae bacterium]|nr:FMN-dependent NADH-azoreductase [Steroidobacteraceae bacterium]
MTTLLQINTSLFGERGNSSQLTRRFIERWRAAHPDGRVVVRDLQGDPLPHLDAERIGALFSKPEGRTPEQQAIVDLSDALIAELKAADIVVIGLPLYNFGIPSTLKTWFDHIARAGVSFRYTANGPEGLIGDRKVYVMAARGGFYQGTPADTQTPFVTNFFTLLGIKDIEFVYAEGLNVSQESKERAMRDAGTAVDRLAA